MPLRGHGGSRKVERGRWPRASILGWRSGRSCSRLAATGASTGMKISTLEPTNRSQRTPAGTRRTAPSRCTCLAESFAPSRNEAVTGAMRRLRFASARRATAAADGACARPCFQRDARAIERGKGRAFGQIILCQRANSFSFPNRLGACKLRGSGARSAYVCVRRSGRTLGGQVSCDTSTKPETPVSWGAAAIGRGRR